MFTKDIGIDLGTASILVYVKGKGVILKEPSVVAFDRDSNEVKAIGEEARLMLGRTPGNIVAVRPLRQGVISDYTVTENICSAYKRDCRHNEHDSVFRTIHRWRDWRCDYCYRKPYQTYHICNHDCLHPAG